MKGSRTVCLLCRRTRAASGTYQASGIVPWRLQGTRPSSTTSAAPTDTSPNHDFTRDSQHISPEQDLEASRKQHRPQVSRRNGQAVRNTNVPQRTGTDRVDALFKEIVTGHSGRPGESNDAATQGVVDMQLIQDIGRLQDMVASGTPMKDAFSYLENQLYPTIRKPGFHIPQLFYSVVLNMMDQIAIAKRDDILSHDLPTVAAICRVYADIGHLKPKRWAKLVKELVVSLVTMSPFSEDYPSIEGYEEYLAQRGELLEDLLESWKILSLPKHLLLKPDANDELHNGFWLPQIDKKSLPGQTQNITKFMTLLFPHENYNQLEFVSILAITSHILFLDPVRSNSNIRRDATRFIRSMDQYVANVQSKDITLNKHIRSMMDKYPPEVLHYVRTEWPKLKGPAEARLGTDTARPESSSSSNPPAPNRYDTIALATSQTINAKEIGSRLSQVHGTRNTQDVDKLWKDFIGGSPDEISTGRMLELRKHPDIFNSFIRIFMTLNSFKKALDAVNTLNKIGLKPTLKTWNLMLDGCKRARNVTAIQNIWAKITTAGISLDKEIWTTRVSGLVEAGGVQLGIAALEEMRTLWNESGRDASKAVEPTIEPINAALNGLIRNRREKAAEKLLAWAGRQGIEPDIFTFNILLRPLVRSQRHDEVRRLLAAMQASGVKADAATFTIMLDAAFSRETPPDAEASIEIVSRVWSDMQGLGLEPNLQTHAKMIYILLQSGDRTKEAVKAVLAHLWSQGQELSSHIYTILVEHYLSRQPPDLDAVDSLLKRRRLLDYDDMDRVFYDRVIKGLALVGETTKALEIYYKLSSMGYQVILSTQMSLLQMLLQQGRAEDARKMVLNTKHSLESQYLSIHGNADEEANFWRHGFWHLADRHRLLSRAEMARKFDTPSPVTLSSSSEAVKGNSNPNSDDDNDGGGGSGDGGAPTTPGS